MENNKEVMIDNKEDLEIIDFELKEDVIEEDELFSLIEQGETVITYSILDLYKNENKKTLRSRSSMKAEPPILSIQDSENNEVNFLLTEEFTKNLIYSLETVNRAYKGLQSKKKEKLTIQNIIPRTMFAIMDNPIPFILIGVLVIIFILGTIFR